MTELATKDRELATIKEKLKAAEKLLEQIKKAEEIREEKNERIPIYIAQKPHLADMLPFYNIDSLDIFTDPRDGEQYLTIKIGDQIWLAENFRHRAGKYYHADRNSSNDAEFGLLYDWQTATDKYFCPPGWHLPSKAEFENLLNYAGNMPFSLLAGHYNGNYNFFGSNAYFWSSTEQDPYYAYELNLSNGNAGMNYGSKGCAFSVRCLKD